MVILQVVNVRWFNATAWYGLYLSRLLAESGHQVVVLTLAGTENHKKALEWGLDARPADLNTSKPPAPVRHPDQNRPPAARPAASDRQLPPGRGLLPLGPVEGFGLRLPPGAHARRPAPATVRRPEPFPALPCGRRRGGNQLAHGPALPLGHADPGEQGLAHPRRRGPGSVSASMRRAGSACARSSAMARGRRSSCWRGASTRSRASARPSKPCPGWYTARATAACA